MWHEHYTGILEKPQIDYMVEKFQSADSIAQQIREQGYRYYLMQDGDGFAGYTAVQVGDGRLFLSKLYIDAACRGRGYAGRRCVSWRSVAAKTDWRRSG